MAWDRDELHADILSEFTERCVPFGEGYDAEDEGDLWFGEFVQAKEFGRTRAQKNAAYKANVKKDPARALLFKAKRAEMARNAYAAKKIVALCTAPGGAA